MSEIQLRMFAFQHAREIEGHAAPINTILATAEAVYRFLIESRGPAPTKN